MLELARLLAQGAEVPVLALKQRRWGVDFDDLAGGQHQDAVAHGHG